MRRLIEVAIRDRLKIELRMIGTPEDEYILFYPYSILLNILNDQTLLYGIIERHYLNPDADNYEKMSDLDNIVEVVQTNDLFEPILGWRDNIDLQIMNVEFGI